MNDEQENFLPATGNEFIYTLSPAAWVIVIFGVVVLGFVIYKLKRRRS